MRAFASPGFSVASTSSTTCKRALVPSARARVANVQTLLFTAEFHATPKSKFGIHASPIDAFDEVAVFFISRPIMQFLHVTVHFLSVLLQARVSFRHTDTVRHNGIANPTCREPASAAIRLPYHLNAVASKGGFVGVAAELRALRPLMTVLHSRSTGAMKHLCSCLCTVLSLKHTPPVFVSDSLSVDGAGR